MKKNYRISYIEDNHLGVYAKEILVEADTFLECVATYINEYPTMFGAKEVFGHIEESTRDFYTHESQDALQRSKREMGKDVQWRKETKKKL